LVACGPGDTGDVGDGEDTGDEDSGTSGSGEETGEGDAGACALCCDVFWYATGGMLIEQTSYPYGLDTCDVMEASDLCADAQAVDPMRPLDAASYVCSCGELQPNEVCG
jgi:hypothetical protein